MQTFHDVPLSDELERHLIQEEIARQMFAPTIDLKHIARRIAALFGHTRVDTALDEPRAAH